MENGNNPTVKVLMSSFNGEKYIRQQLDSILYQKGVNVRCLVRDDGSQDGTVEIIKEYEESGDADYYSFSDQDDVWMEEKLAKCVGHLNPEANVPEMCFCNSVLVTENLEPIRNWFDKEDIMPHEIYRRALESMAAGCTIVFNKQARDAFLKGNCEKLDIHDFWIYVLCSFLGEVYYESTPLTNYRQHKDNIIGNKNDFKTVWRNRVKQLKRITHRREVIVSELIKNFGNIISEKDVKKLLPLRDYRKNILFRFKLLFSKDYTMPTRKQTFWFKVHVLLGNV